MHFIFVGWLCTAMYCYLLLEWSSICIVSFIKMLLIFYYCLRLAGIVVDLNSCLLLRKLFFCGFAQFCINLVQVCIFLANVRVQFIWWLCNVVQYSRLHFTCGWIALYSSGSEYSFSELWAYFSKCSAFIVWLRDAVCLMHLYVLTV